MLLAPLQKGDKENEILCKLRVVARYLDIHIARRFWNWRSTGYNRMQYSMFQLAKKIRGKTCAELVDFLTESLNQEKETFVNNNHDNRYRLQESNRNRSNVRYLLARMTDFVETKTQPERKSYFPEYNQSGRKKGYEIEHIWANHKEMFTDEFVNPDDPYDFKHYRSRIGGLLLLPKSINASLSDKPYGGKDGKYEHYYGQNLLAKSLHEKAYENNPGFLRFIEETGLRFRPHPEFKKADLDARQDLYHKLAEHIWNPADLERELDA